MRVVESPTSSELAPTEINSAETVPEKEVEKVEFKEEDGLKVDKRSHQNFLMITGLNKDTALKCPHCGMLTAHKMCTVVMYDTRKNLLDIKEKIDKRIIGCMNCGYIRTK